ncbi:uncharacterized protein [Nicotiana sylvestris]|uniref:uncharacterized protein n=1 Tax=Nicotiana sylvestris TaxID=4096 RepID=UPI00388C50A9
MNLVSTIFDKRSYGGWRRALVNALSAKNKLGFIDGILTIPQADSVLQKTWQGNSSVSTYFTKMKSLWDELDALNTFSACVCECECGAKLKNSKAHQDERLLQFLMGLNDIFIGVKSNILLSLPYLPWDKLIHWFNENKGQKGSFDPRKNAGICTYYKKPEHTIDKCYRIHGFPADFKYTKQRKFQENVQENAVFNTNEEGIQGNTNVPGKKSLTQENVTQLLHLLQQVNIGQQGAGTSEASANLSCAGIAKIFNSFACFIQIDSESWILDSGATEHMTFYIIFFINYKALPKPVIVNPPNSHRVKVTHSSSVALLLNLVLHNVLLGHMPLSNMKKISGVSVPSCFTHSTPYLICPMARKSKLLFPSNSISTKKIFELIHVDIWGPYKDPTYDGYKYFLTIVDDYSRGTWTYLLSNKSNAFIVLKSYLIMVQRQFHTKVNIIRSDNASELGSGIVQTRASYLPTATLNNSFPLNLDSSSPLVSFDNQHSTSTPSLTPTVSSPTSYPDTLIRKSTMPHNPPTYLKDYICNAFHLSDEFDSLHKSPVFCPLDHLLTYLLRLDPRQPNLNVALRVLRYLLKDPGLGLFMSSSPSYQLLAFYDSDWATCPNSRKSFSGFYISLGSSPISWK